MKKKRDKGEINGSMTLRVSAEKMLLKRHVCYLVFLPINLLFQTDCHAMAGHFCRANETELFDEKSDSLSDPTLSFQTVCSQTCKVELLKK